ncbi:hypothetical protein FVE85_6718 [Porphyridium purpureum]|uniref:Uncharacterized protein n=1 Tax=Porphyridium purpureum TaxID=35688 RepID=A0A5J4Z8H5_PORPP|nr:hypothetical protein FVE85_6718 [Porphyridium purpureum]|eukprot:POR6114..scf295_1
MESSQRQSLLAVRARAQQDVEQSLDVAERSNRAHISHTLQGAFGNTKSRTSSSSGGGAAPTSVDGERAFWSIYPVDVARRICNEVQDALASGISDRKRAWIHEVVDGLKPLCMAGDRQVSTSSCDLDTLKGVALAHMVVDLYLFGTKAGRDLSALLTKPLLDCAKNWGSRDYRISFFEGLVERILHWLSTDYASGGSSDVEMRLHSLSPMLRTMLHSADPANYQLFRSALVSLIASFGRRCSDALASILLDTENWVELGTTPMLTAIPLGTWFGPLRVSGGSFALFVQRVVVRHDLLAMQDLLRLVCPQGDLSPVALTHVLKLCVMACGSGYIWPMKQLLLNVNMNGQAFRAMKLDAVLFSWAYAPLVITGSTYAALSGSVLDAMIVLSRFFKLYVETDQLSGLPLCLHSLLSSSILCMIALARSVHVSETDSSFRSVLGLQADLRKALSLALSSLPSSAFENVNDSDRNHNASIQFLQTCMMAGATEATLIASSFQLLRVAWGSGGDAMCSALCSIGRSVATLSSALPSSSSFVPCPSIICGAFTLVSALGHPLQKVRYLARSILQSDCPLCAVHSDGRRFDIDEDIHDAHFGMNVAMLERKKHAHQTVSVLSTKRYQDYTRMMSELLLYCLPALLDFLDRESSDASMALGLLNLAVSSVCDRESFNAVFIVLNRLVVLAKGPYSKAAQIGHLGSCAVRLPSLAYAHFHALVNRYLQHWEASETSWIEKLAILSAVYRLVERRPSRGADYVPLVQTALVSGKRDLIAASKSGDSLSASSCSQSTSICLAILETLCEEEVLDRARALKVVSKTHPFEFDDIMHVSQPVRLALIRLLGQGKDLLKSSKPGKLEMGRQIVSCLRRIVILPTDSPGLDGIAQALAASVLCQYPAPEILSFEYAIEDSDDQERAQIENTNLRLSETWNSALLDIRSRFGASKCPHDECMRTVLQYGWDTRERGKFGRDQFAKLRITTAALKRSRTASGNAGSMGAIVAEEALKCIDKFPDGTILKGWFPALVWLLDPHSYSLSQSVIGLAVLRAVNETRAYATSFPWEEYASAAFENLPLVWRHSRDRAAAFYECTRLIAWLPSDMIAVEQFWPVLLDELGSRNTDSSALVRFLASAGCGNLRSMKRLVLERLLVPLWEHETPEKLNAVDTDQQVNEPFEPQVDNLHSRSSGARGAPLLRSVELFFSQCADDLDRALAPAPDDAQNATLLRDELEQSCRIYLACVSDVSRDGSLSAISRALSMLSATQLAGVLAIDRDRSIFDQLVVVYVRCSILRWTPLDYSLGSCIGPVVEMLMESPYKSWEPFERNRNQLDALLLHLQQCIAESTALHPLDVRRRVWLDCLQCAKQVLDTHRPTLRSVRLQAERWVMDVLGVCGHALAALGVFCPDGQVDGWSLLAAPLSVFAVEVASWEAVRATLHGLVQRVRRFEDVM